MNSVFCSGVVFDWFRVRILVGFLYKLQGVLFAVFGFRFFRVCLSLPPSPSPPPPFWRPAWVSLLLFLSAHPAGLRRTSATWSGGSSMYMFSFFLFFLSLPGSAAVPPLSFCSLSLSLSICMHALRDKPQTRRRLCFAVRVSHDDLADRTAFAIDERHKFQTSQLSTLGYWPTVVLMGDGELRGRRIS